MLKAWRTVENKLHETEDLNHKGAWVSLVKPTETEIQRVNRETGVMLDFLKAPLDDEERPRIEVEEGTILIIINIPTIESERGRTRYDTIPFGMIVTANNLITVCLEDNILLEDFVNGRIKTWYTFKKTRFIFQILYRTAALYLKYLKEIDKKTNDIERELHRSMRNEQLIKLLDLEKSLVYFNTSLKANEIVMEKLLKSPFLKMYPEDQDLLEDVITENKQAIDMAEIYSSILSGMMDAFASIISNNLNMVMKFLASVTIILALPTMVASFFGMNVVLPMQDNPFAFIFTVGLSLTLSGAAIIYLVKKNMF
ncbi:magnesium transporter CorA family protein [Metallumcola ferriviriculae]|uniref:Magnesium transporter CorA family protein n=1 Tax=Metallumcola ferriviriculae TaxID=3039180 RepID=A0AAU0US26_9FIRM|nr:magnesium transporter CorA family protein [Desulfitibacteraceae bacterium MK1]